MVKHNLIFILLISLSFVFFLSVKVSGIPKNNISIRQAYELYKNKFLTPEGRIIDPDKKNITTSEGQSYMMMLCIIFDDEKTFKQIYKWTQDNLQRDDKLFSWLWGKDKDGKYKILDENSASDADVDIAYSLIAGYKKWRNPQYLKDAKEIINAIWEHEIKRVGDHLVLMPGVIQTQDKKIEVNPSYFSPYAFRMFNNYDELHDWNTLVDSSYYYLNQVTSLTATGLPPDWFLIENGKIVLEDSERSDFSYDAVRVFSRIYFDFILTGDKRALEVITKSKVFIQEWNNSRSIHTSYKKNGELRDNSQYLGTVSIIVPIISIFDKEIAIDIYQNKLSSKFNDKNYWQSKNNYYGKNLSLFGWFLYDKKSKEYKDLLKLKILKK